ncbi:MAG: DDE-type integrase/transposase/recombinase [bacterium]|nr:DDE-type integrase/transposase/recombinase [bacterium]
MAEEIVDPRLKKALCRYEVISAYIAAQPGRGQKGPLLRQLAARTWTDEEGEPMAVKPETLRVWVRRYRKRGLEGLMDKARPRRGVQVLTPEQAELVCRLRREVPERSLDRIITMVEQMGLLGPGLLRRSTLHRVLRAEGLSQRACRVPDAQDLDRREADRPNDLWQSDMLVGPWLPDPERPGKMRRAYLYAFLDDHSRLLLHGRFSFKGDLPALELVFRRCLQKYGVPVRVYYDNGKVYRSGHMKQIVAVLGIHGIVFTKTYRPQGHGKIEALNRYIRSAFLAELAASPQITTLDALNEAFVAWADTQYNRTIHSETGQQPLYRWRDGAEKIEYADEERLYHAFRWRERRTPDKTAIFSLLGCRYQAGARLARRRIEVRYDPEELDEVELWLDDVFQERARPFEVHAHRRPRDPGLAQSKQAPAEPTANWLAHLVEQRCETGFDELPPRQVAEQLAQARAEADTAVVGLLRTALDATAIDEAAVREYLDRYGPFDPERARNVVERLLATGLPDDIHSTVVLEAIRDDSLRKEQS